MNLLADENIERAIILKLREAGYAVTAIAEATPGIADIAVIEQASQTQMILITGDKDFGDLLFTRRFASPGGVILLRLPASMTSEQKAELVLNVFQAYASRFTGAFTVISTQGVRVVPLPLSP